MTIELEHRIENRPYTIITISDTLDDGRPISTRFEVDAATMKSITLDDFIGQCYDMLSDVALDVLAPYM